MHIRHKPMALPTSSVLSEMYALEITKFNAPYEIRTIPMASSPQASSGPSCADGLARGLRAGTVVAVGELMSNLSAGDRVMCGHTAATLWRMRGPQQPRREPPPVLHADHGPYGHCDEPLRNTPLSASTTRGPILRRRTRPRSRRWPLWRVLALQTELRPAYESR
ncbi:hypothetical protein F5Y19DRAFT_479151 [Xylariaceae sp. FL1651]|nr:hypothetical protein F5Y19DRAFT_479151 [Xylariaceae sp. FL1651]